LHAGKLNSVPWDTRNPNAEVHFRLINVQNDAKVVSAINEREKQLFGEGFDKIIGLRDMYSRLYKKRSPGAIDIGVNEAFICGANSSVNRMSEPDKISIHFSIMELESWWLSMHNLFQKIDSKLTTSYIKNELGYELSSIDVEKCFFHPASELTKILLLANIEYKKKLADVESITAHIDLQDILDAVENNRCSSFKVFFDDLKDFVA